MPAHHPWHLIMYSLTGNLSMLVNITWIIPHLFEILWHNLNNNNFEKVDLSNCQKIIKTEEDLRHGDDRLTILYYIILDE